MVLETVIHSHNEQTVAAPIIKQVVYNILKENKGKEVPLRYLKTCVNEMTDQEFSNGSFSGAMRDLVEETNGRVMNVERGIYKYVVNVKRTQINNAIDRLINELANLTIDNVLELSQDDIQTIHYIPNLIEHLQQLKVSEV